MRKIISSIKQYWVEKQTGRQTRRISETSKNIVKMKLICLLANIEEVAVEWIACFIRIRVLFLFVSKDPVIYHLCEEIWFQFLVVKLGYAFPFLSGLFKLFCESTIIGTSILCDSLYRLCLSSLIDSIALHIDKVKNSKTNSYALWHKHLGHIHKKEWANL